MIDFNFINQWLKPGSMRSVDHPNAEIEFPIDDLSKRPLPLERAPSPPLPGTMPPWTGGLNIIPRGYREAVIQYGNPHNLDTNSIDKNWERTHMVVARDLPGQWNGNKRDKCKLYVHKLFEPHLYEFLRRCQFAGIIDEIDSIGCFNYRKIRHSKDPKAPLSFHSFGVAIDINSKDNAAWYRTAPGSAWNPQLRRGPVGKPFSENWHATWPHGVSPALVAALESVGMQWGGRWAKFIDPMHAQLVIS
jgi:hypothetical protein